MRRRGCAPRCWCDPRRRDSGVVTPQNSVRVRMPDQSARLPITAKSMMTALLQWANSVRTRRAAPTSGMPVTFHLAMIANGQVPGTPPSLIEHGAQK